MHMLDAIGGMLALNGWRVTRLHVTRLHLVRRHSFCAEKIGCSARSALRCTNLLRVFL